MAQVTNYHIMMYGGPDGYQTNRAQISLMNGITPLAYLRFNDPGMHFENDYKDNGIIRMFLPSTMFQAVVDLLRNESPVFIHFLQGRGFLEVGQETVGEGEI